jgi:hypothetical protein
MKLYKCLYLFWYGYKDGVKHSLEDWIDIESEQAPTEQEVIKTLEGNNLLPKLLISVDVYSITEVKQYKMSCNNCKNSYKRDAEKEPCMYCHGHSHWEEKTACNPS